MRMLSCWRLGIVRVSTLNSMIFVLSLLIYILHDVHYLMPLHYALHMNAAYRRPLSDTVRERRQASAQAHRYILILYI